MWRALIFLFLAMPVAAHPLPTMRYDRKVEVRLTAAGAFVKYTVELNEWSMVLDKDVKATEEESARIKAAPPSQKAAATFYVMKRAAILADGMIAIANGNALRFRLQDSPEMHQDQEHLKLVFHFVADWPKELDRTKLIQFQFEDTNFDSVVGRLWLTLAAESGVTVINLVDPGDLRGLSPLELKPGDVMKLRKAAATFELPRKAAEPIASVEAVKPVIVSQRPGLAEDLWGRGLPALFESEAGVGLLLLAAMLFGMAHAFTPGHGKTLVAAYLVGERGTFRHALVLGLSTTLAHTGSVIGVAIVLWSLYRNGVPETAQGWLQFAGGMLILVVGLWLLFQRLRGRADHVHLFNDHHHHHGAKSFGWGRVLLLGLGGGLIPCWDAVMLLLVAISAGRLAFAIPMLIAFSVGLAAVLVALGVGVVLAHRAGSARFGERRWFKALPIVSAALLVMMGLWLAREGVQQLSAAAKG